MTKLEDLDFEDVHSLFRDNPVPLRHVVQDLKQDGYKRGLFLEHLRQLKELRKKQSLAKQGGRNYLQENANSLQSYLISHSVDKLDYFNAQEARRGQALKRKEALEQAKTGQTLLKLH